MFDITLIMPVKLKTAEEIPWLGQAIESARKQVKKIVIANDHSLVDWKEVEKILTSKKIKVVDVPDGRKGVAAARNTALAEVNTEFVMNLDSDDYLAQDAVAKLMAAFPGKGYVYGAFVMFKDDKFDRPFYQEFTPDLLTTYQHFIPSGVLHLTADMLRIGWPEQVTAFEDWDFYLKCLESNLCPASIPDVTVYYRQHKNSVMASLGRYIDMKYRSDDIVKSRHPRLYNGEITMCCGHRLTPRITTTPAPKTSRIQPLASVPQNGMIMMQYIGGGSATRSWYGASTGTRYRFGGKLKVNYVWEGDVAQLLRIQENGKAIFAKAEK